MIKVVFKNKGMGYDEDNKYTFSSKGFVVDLAVGDVVVVNTRYGFALAKVVEVDVVDSRFKEEDLATVFSIVQREEERLAAEKKAQERKKQIEALARKAKLQKVVYALTGVISGEEIRNLDMTDAELDEFLKLIK